MPIPSLCGERSLRRSRTGWIPPSPLVQINLYQGEILPYNTELVGQAFGSLVGWIVREDRSSAFQSERGQVHRPTEQILLGNQVHLYRGNFIVQPSKFCLVIRFVPGGGGPRPRWLFVLYQGGRTSPQTNNQAPKITKQDLLQGSAGIELYSRNRS